MGNIISERSKDQIYKNDLKILLDIKKSVGLLNNAIHDKVALIAINILEKKYRSFRFSYYGAGVGGPDLIGKKENKIKLVAEIKTTTIENGLSLRGPQFNAIKEDLVRLKKSNIEYKYLIVISKKVEKNIKKRFDFEKDFRNINILNIF